MSTTNNIFEQIVKKSAILDETVTFCVSAIFEIENHRKSEKSRENPLWIISVSNPLSLG